MRKLAALAVLALSLLTVACTESEDVGTEDEAASLDDVDQLAFDDEPGSLTERSVPSDGAAETASKLGETGIYVPPTRKLTTMEHAADPITDRLGPTGTYVPPTRPRSAGGTGDATDVAECFTPSKLYSDQPIVGEVSSAELGRRAQIRYQQIAKLHRKAPAIRVENIGAPTKR
jgi:hypothetical protein